MRRDIVIDIPHALGAEEAKRRLAAWAERLRAAFGAKLSEAEVSWTGLHADLRVGAFGQRVTAGVDVGDTNVRIAIVLPFVLAIWAGGVAEYLEREGGSVLRLEHRPTPDRPGS